MDFKISSLVLVLSLAGVAANAQVAPPPPAEKPDQPEYRPPARPQAPAAQPQQPGERPTRPQGPERLSGLPLDLPYPKLAEVGEDGRIRRLQNLPEIVALRANPTVGDASVDEIMPVIYGRRARFEMLVIDNLDLMWEFMGGLIETMDMTDLNELARVAEMIRPMVGKTGLSEELMNRGILTRIQGGMNEHIVREYKQAISEDIQKFEGTDGVTGFMRFILEDSIQEAYIAYYGMLVELKAQAGPLLEHMGIENEALASLTGTASEDGHEREGQVNEMHNALMGLGLDNAIKALQVMRQSRENPNISPTVVRIDVNREGKTSAVGGTRVFRVDENNPRRVPSAPRGEE